MPRPTERGFTLIEVLIALAVIAIGLIAVLAVAARSGRVASDLQERSFADWVAENQFTEMRLSPAWPAVGKSNGSVSLGNLQWQWEAVVAPTQDQDLRRVTLAVSLAATPDQPITQLIGFLGKPMPRTTVASPGTAGKPAPPTGAPKPGTATGAGAG